MNNQQIMRCLQECASKLKIDLNMTNLGLLDIIPRNYSNAEIFEFQKDLIESANDVGIVLLEKHLDYNTLKDLITDSRTPLIVFKEHEGFNPAFIRAEKKGIFLEFVTINGELNTKQVEDYNSINFSTNGKGEVLTLSCFTYQNFLNSSQEDEKKSSFRRLFQLLSAD